MDETPPQLRFHKATADDITLMAELSFAACKKKIYDCYNYSFTQAETEADIAHRRGIIEENFRDNDFCAFIAHDMKNGGQPCGIVSVLLPDAQGKGCIQDLYAVSGGLTGALCLKHAKDFLAQNGASSIGLEANPDSIPFYERNGFRNISADPHKPWMECRL